MRLTTEKAHDEIPNTQARTKTSLRSVERIQISEELVKAFDLNCEKNNKNVRNFERKILILITSSLYQVC